MLLAGASLVCIQADFTPDALECLATALTDHLQYDHGLLDRFKGTRCSQFIPVGRNLALGNRTGEFYNTVMLPNVLSYGGAMMWVLLLASVAAVAVFIERALHLHRAQINSTEFLNGVRTVLKRDNIVEAVSICDATPGPVSHLVKTAILNRDQGRERLREALEEAGLAEVPRLERRLNLLATISQLAPLLGLLGTVLGFIKVFQRLEEAGLYAHLGQLSQGLWQALICMAAGLAVAIPAYAGYNYLVSRVNAIVLDMERAATEIVNIVTDPGDTTAS